MCAVPHRCCTIQGEVAHGSGKQHTFLLLCRCRRWWTAQEGRSPDLEERSLRNQGPSGKFSSVCINGHCDFRVCALGLNPVLRSELGARRDGAWDEAGRKSGGCEALYELLRKRREYAVIGPGVSQRNGFGHAQAAEALSRPTSLTPPVGSEWYRIGVGTSWKRL